MQKYHKNLNKFAIHTTVIKNIFKEEKSIKLSNVSTSCDYNRTSEKCLTSDGSKKSHHLIIIHCAMHTQKKQEGETDFAFLSIGKL